MGNHILFQESQRFRNPYVWVFLIVFSSVVIGSVAWILVRQFGLGNPVGGTELPPGVLAGLGLVIIALAVAVVLFFAALRLQTEVTEAGLFLRFAPMHRRARRIDLAEATGLAVAEGNGVAAYGGIGIRRRPHATAYLLHGQGGVRIDFANDCHVYVGSYRAQELAAALGEVVEKGEGKNS